MKKIKEYINNHKIVWLLLVLFSTGLISACNDLLDAENPNSLLEEDLSDPRASTPMVNGSLSLVTRALTNIYTPYSTASDELLWIGSRDAWQQLQFGNVANPSNEFTDAAFFFVAESRWWADDVISRLEEFRDAGTIPNEAELSRAYFYGAIIYITIGDMFDDFAFSNKKEAAPPVGKSNMVNLYDTAIDYLTKGLAISGISDNLKMNIYALLARAHHAKGVWNKLKSGSSVNTADPYVTSTEMITAAQEALTLMGSGDYKFKLQLDGSLPGINASTDGFGLPMPQQVNQRQEMRLSDNYIIADGATVAAIGDGNPATSISLMDPIDGTPDPALYTAVVEFTTEAQFSDITVISAREMHLILAEAAEAGGATGKTFTEHINDLRSLDGLSPFAGEISNKEMLVHARKVNLFLQGRRLADHYRFDDPSNQWQANTDATTTPGTFFPITISEIRANPNLN